MGQGFFLKENHWGDWGGENINHKCSLDWAFLLNCALLSKPRTPIRDLQMIITCSHSKHEIVQVSTYNNNQTQNELRLQKAKTARWSLHGCTHLNTDAALQFKLQPDHVHLGGRAQQLQFGHFCAHLVDGDLDGAEVTLVLIHDGDALLHVGETVSG